MSMFISSSYINYLRTGEGRHVKWFNPFLITMQKFGVTLLLWTLYLVCICTHKKKESQEKTKQQKESTQNKRISLYSFHSFRKIKFGMLPKHNLKTKKQIIKTTVLYLWLKKHHNTPLHLQKPMISVCHVEIPALNEDNVYKDTRWVFFKKHIMKRIYRVPRNSCKTHAPWQRPSIRTQ